MNPEIRGTMRRQFGLITRRQAVGHGMSAREVDRKVRSGEWVAVRRGVYAEEATFSAPATPSDRQRLRDEAACLRIAIPHVRSHDSAALVLGLPVLLPDRPMTHLTRRARHPTRNTFGVKIHRAPHTDGQVVDVDGIRCLDPARTAVDIARELGHPHGVVAYDSALRLGVPLLDIENAIDPMENWPHVRRARAELELADPGTDSVNETLGRSLVTSLGFGRPQTQFGITDGRRTAWVDLRLGRHLFEIDGRVKYGPDSQPGKSPDQILWEEKKRQDWLTGFKLGMSRIVHADFFGDQRGRAEERLTREYLDTCRRFGTSIADLAPYLIHGRRPRPGLDRAWAS